MTNAPLTPMQFIVNQMLALHVPPVPKDVQVAKLYKAGATWGEIAKKTGVHGASISQSLRRSGIPLRGPNRIAPDERIKELYMQGHTWAYIAEKVGVTPGTVGRSLARTGAERRQGHGRRVMK